LESQHLALYERLTPDEARFSPAVPANNRLDVCWDKRPKCGRYYSVRIQSRHCELRTDEWQTLNASPRQSFPTPVSKSLKSAPLIWTSERFPKPKVGGSTPLGTATTNRKP